MRHQEDEVVGIFTLDESLSKTKARFAPLGLVAGRHGVPVQQISDVNEPSVVAALREMRPDVIFEIGWSQKIGRGVLDIPPLGCIGIHDSLLPNAQGAASINWALIWGEHTWGVSLFYLAEEFDKGDIIGQRAYEITDEDDINTVFDRADANAVDLLREMLPRIHDGTAPRVPQNSALVTKTYRRTSQDGLIDWSKGNREVYNLVRALKKPYPPAFTFLRGQKVLVLDARVNDVPSPGAGVIGEVTSAGMMVGTSYGSLLVSALQAKGGDELDAIAFSKAHQVRKGDRFGD
jgi:methionyl-tRNA formyltransferase